MPSTESCSQILEQLRQAGGTSLTVDSAASLMVANGMIEAVAINLTTNFFKYMQTDVMPAKVFCDEFTRMCVFKAIQKLRSTSSMSTFSSVLILDTLKKTIDEQMAIELAGRICGANNSVSLVELEAWYFQYDADVRKAQLAFDASAGNKTETRRVSQNQIFADSIQRNDTMKVFKAQKASVMEENFFGKPQNDELLEEGDEEEEAMEDAEEAAAEEPLEAAPQPASSPKMAQSFKDAHNDQSFVKNLQANDTMKMFKPKLATNLSMFDAPGVDEGEENMNEEGEEDEV